MAENDEENVSVFAKHFMKVLNDKNDTDHEVLENVDSRNVLFELNHPHLGGVHGGSRGADKR